MFGTRRRSRSNLYSSAGLVAATTVATAAAVYFFDPRSGRRRRALVRDQMSRATHQSREFVSKVGRDARQRATGLYQRSASHFRDTANDDSVLTDRVRTELGRLSAHPGAIEASCDGGGVRLTGDVLEHELAALLAGVRRVRGVEGVINQLRVHNDAGSIPGLQGDGNARLSRRFEFLQENWGPAPRALAGAAGIAMMLGGLGRRSPIGLGLATVGAGLLGRSVSNTAWSRLFGMGAEAEDGILVQKTVQVYADLDEAYSCWRNLENFPQFMSHVREVARIDDTHYHWKVDGPAGVPVEWDAVITAEVPGELIAWRTVEGSAVQSSGVVQFEPTSYGGTRIHVRMSYRPPANVLGHTVAKIFGRDPQRQMDADLARFKTYIETGRAPRDSAAAAASSSRH